MYRAFGLIPFLLLIALLPAAALAQDKAAQIDALLQKYHDLRLFNGTALVAERGEVVYEKGFGAADMEFEVPNTPDTRFLVGSVTKNFTAALILQLMEEGKIDLQAPLTRYLPAYPAGVGDRVTVHHLLTHTSGIHSYTSLPEFITEIAPNPHEPAELIARVQDLPLDFEPGTDWSYNNSGYVLLGMIIEAVTGRPYHEVLRERLLEPAGMTNAGYYDSQEIVPRLAHGYLRTPTAYVHAYRWNMTTAYAAGAMYATPRDLYRWDRALAAQQIFDDAATFDLFYGPHHNGYGYGWFTTDRSIGEQTVRVVEHGGGLHGFITAFRRFPDDGHLIVLADNTMGPELSAISDGITAILYGETPAEPTPSVADAVAPLIEAEGYEAARAEYRRLRSEQPDAYDFAESELNALGYLYLQAGAVESAIATFRLNVEAYPEAFNTYNSLGDAYMEAGETELAVANYRKSLGLNPGNTNAVALLEKLGAEAEELAEEIALTEAQLDRYVGTYQLQPGFDITVTREGTRLLAQATGQGRHEIFPQSEARFYYKVVAAQIEFHDYGDGQADSLTLYQGGQQIRAPRLEP